MKVMGPARLVVGLSSLAGCSLLYNPSELPPAHVEHDAAVVPDATVDPDALSLAAAAPAQLFEGQGVDGSRQALLVISGLNIGTDATVSLAPTDPAAAMPMLTIDNDHALRSLGGGLIAVQITLPVDPTNTPAGKQVDIPVTIQVAQTGSTGPVMATLTQQLTVSNLPELDKPLVGGVLAKQYSRVKLAAGLSFASLAGGSARVVRSMSSIELGDVHNDAAGATPGQGGGAGGVALQAGAGPGGGSPGTLLTGASGAGFAVAGGLGAGNMVAGAMVGESLIVSYGTSFAAGGGGGAVTGVSGGGGGGTLELTAGGTLKVGKISAIGGAGAAGGALSGGGGGGAGGVIVLRGTTAMIDVLNVAGGGGGTGGALNIAPGGKGSSGRIRIDTRALSGVLPTFDTATRRGVAFTDDNPLLTINSKQAINLISVIAAEQFPVFVLDAANKTTFSGSVMFGTSTASVTPPLTPGYNRVCVTSPGGNPSLDESTSCVELAYAADGVIGAAKAP